MRSKTKLVCLAQKIQEEVQVGQLMSILLRQSPHVVSAL